MPTDAQRASGVNIAAERSPLFRRRRGVRAAIALPDKRDIDKPMIGRPLVPANLLLFDDCLAFPGRQVRAAQIIRTRVIFWLAG
jgi:hypothetical protein